MPTTKNLPNPRSTSKIINNLTSSRVCSFLEHATKKAASNRARKVYGHPWGDDDDDDKHAALRRSNPAKSGLITLTHVPKSSIQASLNFRRWEQYQKRKFTGMLV